MDLITYSILRQYVDASIEGTSGVIAGKNAQITSVEEIEVDGRTGHRITFSWYKDGETVARTDSIDVMDGEKGDVGDKGEKGDTGFSPEITVAEATSETYKLHIKNESEEYDTPNLKGNGGGVDVHTEEEKLIFTY